MKQVSGVKLLAGIVGAAAGFVIYKAGKIYLLRRKYRHIPGPETKGFKFGLN
jgi:hypothetical protein